MKRDYYIFKSGDIKKENFNIIFKTGNEKIILPINDIDNIFIYGSVNLNSDAINYLGEKDINTHFFNYYGIYRSSLTGIGSQHSGNTHIHQAEFYLNKDKRKYIAAQFIISAIWHMNKNLMEHNIGYENSYISNINQSLLDARDISEIMGIEGSFRKNYYAKFDTIIKNKNFKFEIRSKRPPLNEVNALISFGNSMIYSICLNSIKNTYLNSTIAFLHECGERRHSLSLDLAEIFKPLIVDRIIFTMLNNNMLKTTNFEKTDEFCYLTESGKKLFVAQIEEKLNTTFYYRKLSKNITYKTLIRLECHKLCKHILNIEEYKSLKTDW